MTHYEDVADRAMTAMLDEIAKHRLETLQHYPDDLRDDRERLNKLAEPGAMFGWKVGHSGTHLFQLGLHQQQNECVTYVTRDSNSDRFYLLKFGFSRQTQKGFRLLEVTAQQFEELSRTPVPYAPEGSNEAFWVVKGGRRVGYCKNEFTGDYQHTSYRTTLTPVQGISKSDLAALYQHARYSCIALAHSLFFQQEVIEAAALRTVA